MPRILHVLDESCGWEQRVAVGQLLERLPAGDYEQHVAAIGGAAAGWVFPKHTITTLRPALGLAAFAAPGLGRLARDCGADVLHTWGTTAAAAAHAALQGRAAVAVTVSACEEAANPQHAPRQVAVLREMGRDRGFAVVCTAERVRRRLVEQGAPIGQTVLLRPAVDFAALNAARERDVRAALGIARDAFVILASDPPAEGHFSVVWSALVRWYLDAAVRVIVPGGEGESWSGHLSEEMRLLAAESQSPEVLVFAGERFGFEELCTAANVLALGDVGEISTTPIAWAMAAGLPIVAPATYAVAELLGHDVNAALYKAPADRRRRGVALCAMYERLGGAAKCAEAARGQAYEVFSLRRCVEQHRTLYGNLVAGRAAGEGINDPARAAG